MRLTGIFNNLTVRTKLSLVSLVLVVFTVCLGGYGYFLLGGNQTKLSELQTGALRETDIVRTFQKDALESMSDLYRLTSTASSESDTKKVEELSKETIAYFDTLQGNFAEVKKVMNDTGFSVTQIDDFEKLVVAYVKASKNVADMVASDVATASAWMTGTSLKYKDMSTSLKGVVTALEDRKKNLPDHDQHGNEARPDYFRDQPCADRDRCGFAVAGAWKSPRLTYCRDGQDRLPHCGKKYAVDIPALDQEDEIGQMAKAVEILREQSMMADEMSEEQAKTADETLHRMQRMDALTRDFDTSITGIIAAVGDTTGNLHAAAETLNAVAVTSSQKASVVSKSADATSNNMQMVAGAVEELSAAVEEISRQANDSSEFSKEAVQQAETTNEVVGTWVKAVDKISEVVGLINTIAGQTNLLALNATIEAARAGEYGKGFAVVASEVKALANQTAKATDEITTQIDNIKQITGSAVRSIHEIKQSIVKMDQKTDQIARAATEEDKAVKEISHNVQQAHIGTQEVSANIGDVSSAADNTGGVATSVRDATVNLSEQTAILKAEVEKFLKGVAS